jgi:radical SAM superfamily enzyme YgiQ (UPF0313 family)
VNAAITLLQPPVSGLDHAKGALSLPLAYVYLAAALPGRFMPQVVDLRRAALSEDMLAAWRREPPVAFGLTAVSGAQSAAAAATARRLRAAGLGPIIWGGKHATLFGEHLVATGLADFAVVGDGEETFAVLAGALAAGDTAPDIRGVWRPGPDGPVFGGAPEPFALERLTHLPFERLEHDYLYRKGEKRVGVLETSRGCPGRCTYCYLSARDNAFWQGAAPEWVMRAVADLTAAFPRANHVDFVDDNFFADRERALGIAQLMPRAHPGLTWTSNGGRLRDMATFTEAELNELAAGGLDRVDIGVETGSPGIAKLLGKSETPGEVIKQVRRLGNAGIRPWVNLMIGFPDETPEDRGQTLDLALEVTAAGAQISPIYAYTPYPGTALASFIAKSGHRLPSVEDLTQQGWSVSRAPWVAPRLARELAAIYSASLFVDDKLTVYRPGRLTRAALAVLRPLSRWRLRRRMFSFPLEDFLLRRFFGDRF